MIVSWSNLNVVFFPGVHPQHHHWHAGGDAGEQNIPDDHLGDDHNHVSLSDHQSGNDDFNTAYVHENIGDFGRHDLQRSNCPIQALQPQGVDQKISSLGIVYPNTRAAGSIPFS